MSFTVEPGEKVAIVGATGSSKTTLVRLLSRFYDSDRGGDLFHGQRRLLSLARVLATDPEILSLDEATSSIDPETEGLIEEALHRITEGRTAIL